MKSNYMTSRIRGFEAIITYIKRNKDGNQKQYYVNLDTNFCSCGHFKDNLIPCLHAGKLICELGLDFRKYTSNYYSSETYRTIYRNQLPHILKSQLYSNSITKCPTIKQKKGRTKSTNRRKSYLEILYE